MISKLNEEKWTLKLEEAGFSHNQAATLISLIDSALTDLEDDIQSSVDVDLDDIREKLPE